MIAAIIVFAGFIVDAIIGDPVYNLHPVRIIGFFIGKGDKLLRRDRHGSTLAFLLGMMLTLFIVGASFVIPFFVLLALHRVHFVLGLIVEIIFCYQIFAAKALKHESMKVYRQLEKGDIPKARKYLSYIVGRDTQNLNEEEITKAAVETVAENCSNGVIGPMLFLFIGGAPLGFAYKAVNTLDSMIGYNNEKYAYFGKFAARLDDVVNFFPARISAMLMLAATPLCKLNLKQAWKIYLRDRHNHKSPNAAQTEAVCAGALGVELSGDNVYGGVVVSKPTIGDPLRPANKDDIRRVNKLMYTASWIGLLIGVALRTACFALSQI